MSSVNLLGGHLHPKNNASDRDTKRWSSTGVKDKDVEEEHLGTDMNAPTHSWGSFGELLTSLCLCVLAGPVALTSIMLSALQSGHEP